jgi:hypothetical protein
MLAIIATTQAILAILFVFQVPWATAIWPFTETGEMSYIFIASIFLAAAAAVGWCLYVGSDRALAGIALDYMVIMAPLGVLSLAAGRDEGSLHAAAFGLLCLMTLAFGAWMLRWALRRPWRSTTATPAPVIAAFALFVFALCIVGTLLILQTPGVLPWAITPQLSVLYGSMFLGAAAYFGYGLIDRRWENAGGQLAGFLAYDIVLIVPFVVRVASGTPSYYGSTSAPLRLNRILYTAVVLLSGLLAAYYLFVHGPTRLRVRRSRAGRVETASELRAVAMMDGSAGQDARTLETEPQDLGR